MANVSFDSNVKLFWELQKILLNIIFRARKNEYFLPLDFFQINISEDIPRSKTGIIPTE